MAKHTKVVCTIGPASESVETLTKMVKAGMNVARLNFSHGTYANHRLLIRNIRQAGKRAGKWVGLLQDLQGPRIRVGTVPQAEGITVTKGQTVVLVPDNKYSPTAQPTQIPVQYPQLAKVVKKGGRIYIKDGLIELRVKSVSPANKTVTCTVTAGGLITSHRGINLPGADITTSVITEKDKKDLAFGLQQQVDWVALSFVRHHKDIDQLRRLITKLKPRSHVKIIAKIERIEALKDFPAILAAADAIMIARGDLGIELPPEQVPIIQKDLIAQCLAASKPVIVATHMLESMTANRRPTRAEVSDVANAVIDHTDAVMLSGESATGDYPVEAVTMMSKTIVRAERSPYDDLAIPAPKGKQVGPSYAIGRSIRTLLEHTHAAAIVVFTTDGTAARLVARFRPEVKVIAITDTEAVARQLVLSWGISPIVMKIDSSFTKMANKVKAMAERQEIAKPGQQILIVADHITPGGPKIDVVKAVVV